MPEGLDEHTSCANTTVQCIWHQKGSQTIAKIIQETKNEFPDIKQTLPVTYTYKKSRQAHKNVYQTATTIQNNLPPLEAWTKNIATKMADSEFRSKTKNRKRNWPIKIKEKWTSAANKNREFSKQT